MGIAATSFDRADEMNELRRARDAARTRFPVLLTDRRVSAQGQEGSYARLQVVVHGGDDLGRGIADAGQVRDRLDRGVSYEALDRRAGIVAILATGTIGYGHEVRANLEEAINRVPEGGFQRGLARGHYLEGEERGLVVVGTGTGVVVVGEGHGETLG